MPRYDYRCDTCSSIQEMEHSMDEDFGGGICYAPLEVEDDVDTYCGGHIKKLFTATPAVFKGQGWGKMTSYKPKQY